MSDLKLPGNNRYQPKSLVPYFGYDNLFKCVAEVEIATLETLAEIGIIPGEDMFMLAPEIKEKLFAITTTEVDRVEREDTEYGKATHHDIRAWVKIAQSILHPCLARWLHIPLTSYDALDTARALQYVRAHEAVVKPLTDKLIELFAGKVRELAEVKQIGRTHGQHALPITAGFWLATILARIVYNAKQANDNCKLLAGKISGAVGAYNAQVGLGIEKMAQAAIQKENREEIGYAIPKTFEGLVLRRLGLEPALISTQTLPPEPLADYLFSIVKLSASLGQLGRDCRNLMRTEIAEVGEPFDEGQVGSSTMVHKRNPITFENTEGMYIRSKNEFGKVFDTMISDHQRDLVGSCVMRDFPIMVVNLVVQLETLLKAKNDEPFISRMTVSKANCQHNLNLQKNVFLAEAMYIALQMAGYEGDAHDLVNHYALKFVSLNGFNLTAATEAALRVKIGDDKTQEILKKIPVEIFELFYHPEDYTGHAVKKALEIADMAEKYISTGK